MPALPVVYTYSACATCRQAVTWLRGHGISFLEKPIRETPPSLPELRQMLTFQEGKIKRLFNTSGRDYRALGVAGQLPVLTEAEALALLAGNGNLTKRPFFLTATVGLVGFDESVWAAALQAHCRK